MTYIYFLFSCCNVAPTSQSGFFGIRDECFRSRPWTPVQTGTCSHIDRVLGGMWWGIGPLPISALGRPCRCGAVAVLNTKIFSYPAISRAAPTRHNKLSFHSSTSSQPNNSKWVSPMFSPMPALPVCFLPPCAHCALHCASRSPLTIVSAQQLAPDPVLHRWVCPPSPSFLATARPLPFPDDPHGPCC